MNCLNISYCGAFDFFKVKTSWISNQAPMISSVQDSPDPLQAGMNINFSVNWADNDNDDTKLHICKTNAITGQTCDGGSWCDTTSFSSVSPSQCSYTTQTGDVGVKNYYAFVCDASDCSASTSGSFTVNANNAPQINSAVHSQDSIGIDMALNFLGYWTDAGDGVKLHICKTNSISSGTCLGGSWCDSQSLTTSSPASCNFTTSLDDVGAHNYYAFVCDSLNQCSSSLYDDFEVTLTFINPENNLQLATTTGSGYIISSGFDTGINGGASFMGLMWKGQLNSGTVKFQIASSNSHNGPWVFYGPTSESDYYIPNPSVRAPFPLSGAASHQNKRYLRYIAILEPSGGQSPRVDDIIIYWSP